MSLTEQWRPFAGLPDPQHLTSVDVTGVVGLDAALVHLLRDCFARDLYVQQLTASLNWGMPTATATTSSAHAASTSTGSTASRVDTKALEDALAHAQSATIYVDMPGVHATAGDEPTPPPAPEIIDGLHVQLDEVRQKLAVRKASAEEVADANAAAAQHSSAAA